MSNKVPEPQFISVDQLCSVERKRIPCCLTADIALSGGMPLGGFVLIGGKPGFGKTTVAVTYAGNAQKLYGTKVFFCDVEGRFSGHVLKQCGNIDKDKFEIIRAPVILDKQTKEVKGHEKWYAENWWNVIGKIIDENTNAIIIVDAIANFSSEKEQSEGVGYEDRGKKNKMEAQFCRMYGNKAVSQEVTVMLLTHVMANTSGYGPALQYKAGNDIWHQCDLILFGKSMDKWTPVNGRILGHDMKCRVDKTSISFPHQEFDLPLRYGQGIDTVFDIQRHAINWDIIKKAGAWFQLPFVEIENEDDPDNPTIEYKSADNISKEDKGIKLQGENSVWNWLVIHPEATKALESKIREMVFGDLNENV